LPCLTRIGEPRPVLANALFALRFGKAWQGVLAYDEFALTAMLMLPPPWQAGANQWVPKRWSDVDDAHTTEWLHLHEIFVPLHVAAVAAQAVAQDQSFHPVRDYLEGLKWDGTPRVAGFMNTYFGAEATGYHSSIGMCLLISAVARVMSPGCKADHVPILESGQGKFKSTALEVLGSPWFSDDIAELGSKDSAMQVRSTWIIEIAELASMHRGEVERVKAFTSRRIDRFRPSYGKHVIEQPRQCVFVGTTNDTAYLKDATGARRFWPAKCGLIDIAALRRDRDQLWAEAVHLYNAGVPWWLSDAESVADAEDAQDQRYQPDPWEATVAGYLLDRDEASVTCILSDLLGIPMDRQDHSMAVRVARCLQHSGWARKRRGGRGERRWVYIKET
jgi:predicted P-loop ATPase